MANANEENDHEPQDDCVSGSSNCSVADVVGHPTIRDTISEAVGNWTQRHGEPDEELTGVFVDLCTRAAAAALECDEKVTGFSGDDWKKDVANEGCRRIRFEEFVDSNKPIVADAVRHRFPDIDEQLDGLFGYSIAKMSNHAAVVAVAMDCGIPVERLRSTPAESNAAMRKLAAAVNKATPGKAIVADTNWEAKDIISEMQRREVQRN